MNHPTPSSNAASNYLAFTEKTYLVMGVANKKSVAYRVAKQIEELGGKLSTASEASNGGKALLNFSEIEKSSYAMSSNRIKLRP